MAAPQTALPELVKAASAFFASFDQALCAAEQEVELLLQTDFRKFYAPQAQQAAQESATNAADAPQQTRGSETDACTARQRRQTWHGAQETLPAELLLDKLAAQAVQSAEATHQLNQVHRARVSKTPPVQPTTSPSLLAEKFMVTTAVPELLFPRLQLASDQQGSASAGRALLSARGPPGTRRISSPLAAPAMLSARGPAPPKPAGAVQRLAQRAGTDSVTPPRAALTTTVPALTIQNASTRLAMAAGHGQATSNAFAGASLGAAAGQANGASPVQTQCSGAVLMVPERCSTPGDAATELPIPATASADASALQPVDNQRSGTSSTKMGNGLQKMFAKLDLSKLQIFSTSDPAAGKPAKQQQRGRQQQSTQEVQPPLTSRRADEETTPLKAFGSSGGAKMQYSRREKRISLAGASPMSASFSGPSWRPTELQQAYRAAPVGYLDHHAHQAPCMAYPQQHAPVQVAHVPGQYAAATGLRPRRASFVHTGSGNFAGQAQTAGPQYRYYVPGSHPAAGYVQYPQAAYADVSATPSTYHPYGQAGYMSGGVWYPGSAYQGHMQLHYAAGPGAGATDPPAGAGGTAPPPPPPPSATSAARRMQSPGFQQRGSNAAAAPVVSKLNLGSLRLTSLDTLREVSQRADDLAPGTDQDI